MNDNPFVDTNIIVYAISDSFEKSLEAKKILDAGCVISTQVLFELGSVLTKKFNWPPEKLRIFVEALGASLHTHINTEKTAVLATEIMEMYSVSWWDSLIIASALDSSCSVLLTEDIQHGLIINHQLTITNSFLPRA